jgi:hypothetical protein
VSIAFIGVVIDMFANFMIEWKKTA